MVKAASKDTVSDLRCRGRIRSASLLLATVSPPVETFPPAVPTPVPATFLLPALHCSTHASPALTPP